MTILAAALELASKVGPVIPVRGKLPLLKDWPNRATRSPSGADWQAATGVGLVTGKRAGYFVLDVDARTGGVEQLQKLERENGPLPRTWTSHTGGGGCHLFFRCPEFAVRGSAGKLARGLDVRGEGGQVVAPPSAHPSGTAYTWAVAPWDCALADAPEWLLAMLRPAPVPAPLPPPRLVHDATGALRRASAYLATIPGAVSGSGGHDQAWRAALAVVRGFNLSESDALALLASEYNPRCTPPWSDKELLHKVQSAAKDARVRAGYLLDAERPAPGHTRSSASVPGADVQGTREPGSDDGDDAPAIPRTRLNLQPISVLLAKQVPEVEWIFRPYLEAKSIAALVSPPNLGKTLLAFWVATQCAANGRRVAIIEEEGGERGFQKRIDRAAQAVGGAEKCVGIDYSFKPRVSLMLPADIKALAAELSGYDLVIIDSLARVTLGLEENDAAEMGLLVANLDHLREQTGATILTLHHTGKAKWKPGEVPTLSDGRGSSALAAGLDTVLSLAPLPPQEQQQGLVQFTLHITKQRDEDNRCAPVRVSIAMTGQAAEVTMAEVEASALFDPLEKLKAAIMDVMVTAPGDGLSGHEIEKLVRGNAVRKREAVRSLFLDGDIEKNHLGRYVIAPSSKFVRTTRDDPRPSSSPYVVGDEAKGRRTRGQWSDPEKDED